MRKIGNYGLALMTVIALGSGVGLTAHAGSVSKTVTSNFTSAWKKRLPEVMEVNCSMDIILF